jgi:hypothetical protein
MSYLTEAARLIRENLPSDARPPEDSDDLFLLYALLLRSKGDEVTAADVHDAWAAWMELQDPSHAAIVPFCELPAATQDMDLPYVRAIHAAAKAQAERGDLEP